jgi:hypothetical protein
MFDPAGLPDWSSAIDAPDANLIGSFGSVSYSVLPSQLQIATYPNGKPKFELDLVQRVGDFSANGQYAELDFSLAGTFPLDAALLLARKANRAATVKPITLSGGFGRLTTTGNAVPLPADTLSPRPLGWWSNDLARFTLRMSPGAGELIKGGLQTQSTFLIGARVEAYALGVAARLPGSASFDPTAVLASLLARNSDRRIAVSDVLSFFASPRSNLPVTLTGVPDGASSLLAQALCDRTIAAYSALTPSPGVTDPPFVQFKPAAQIEPGSVQWDLNEPAPGVRAWVFMLDLFGSVRALSDPAVLAGLVKNVSVPATTLGLYRVDLSASLPVNRVGVAAVGARVDLPAKPPARPASISKTAIFAPPADEASVELALATTEALSYSVTCFGVVAGAALVQEVDAPPKSHDGDWVLLSAEDFPLVFANVAASARLLSLATIEGSLHYEWASRAVDQPFALAAAASGASDAMSVSVAAPAAATNVSLTVKATPLDGSAPVSLSSMGAGRVDLDVQSFPGFGPHEVAIEAQLDPGAAPLFVELIAETSSADPQSVPGKVALTGDQPNATWGYVATSPFRSGYCYRVATDPGTAARPWSAPRSADTPLVLDAQGTDHSTAPDASSFPGSSPGASGESPAPAPGK